MVDWVNSIIALSGLFLAIIALLQTRRSNRTADEANSISRSANELSGSANRLAERALQMQEDEGKVRLSIKPRMMILYSEQQDDDSRPRPVVEVVNLSGFPVTVTGIHWRAEGAKGKCSFYWKNPTIANPFGQLPVRLPPREALTAVGTPDSFENANVLASITAAVAYTACGEEFEGMTDQWRETVAKLVADSNSNDVILNS